MTDTPRSVQTDDSAGRPGFGGAASPHEAMEQFYKDVKAFLESEMAMQEEEWAYLLRSNTLLLTRYRELNARANAVTATVEQAQQHLDLLPTYFTKIEQLERNIETIESVVRGLDQYSRILEQRFAPTTAQA